MVNQAYIIDVLKNQSSKLKYIDCRIDDLMQQLNASKSRSIKYKETDILRGMKIKDIVPGKVSARYYETGFPFVEKQLDNELKYQAKLNDQIEELIKEQECIYRIMLIFNSLDDLTHQLLTYVYIDQCKWEYAKDKLHISNNKFAAVKKGGLEDIIKIYNSDLTNEQIEKFTPKVYSSKKEKNKKIDSMQICFDLKID